jgi:hypothetical protein
MPSLHVIHAPHEPPQSTPVSFWFFSPSKHVGLAGDETSRA